jgi:molybdopterin-containing oxidoreductase family membrane subunit
MALGAASEGGEDMEAIGPWRQRLEDTTYAPIAHTSKIYWVWLSFLLAVIAWGGYAYYVQVRDGLIVTGLSDRISWGFYITNFVFFIGISHAGTLISAILRVSKAGWRTPVTRMAEFITVVALCCGALFPIIDLGRPDRLQNVILYGRWQSPIIWDVVAITTYLTASITYLGLPMIPDLAIFRDRTAGWRKWLYSVLAIGWTGERRQRSMLATIIATMMILIIPIAVSVHTVVSWIFAMNLRVGWNSTIFGAFFVAGAIFSGVATLVIIMAILRKVYHLEEYILEKHFVYLGYLLAAMALIMIYGNLSEFITTGYKMEAGTEFHMRELFLGQFAGYYWYYFIGGLVVPPLLILMPWTRNIWGVVAAAFLIDVAMWIERYFIVVATLRVPLMPYEPRNYGPTWVEWSIIAASFALFGLLITLFVKVFPLLAIWEITEQREESQAPVTESLLGARTQLAGEPAGGAV